MPKGISRGLNPVQFFLIPFTVYVDFTFSCKAISGCPFSNLFCVVYFSECYDIFQLILVLKILLCLNIFSVLCLVVCVLSQTLIKGRQCFPHCIPQGCDAKSGSAVGNSRWPLDNLECFEIAIAHNLIQIQVVIVTLLSLSA